MARQHRSWRQRLVIAGGTLSALVFAVGASGIAYLYRKAEQLPRVELSQSLEPSSDAREPRNVLIVGVDSAERLEPGDPVRFGRDGEVELADVIMILRVDSESSHADLLSIPRDLLVSYPGSRDQARINRALDRAGGSPDLLIDTLDDYLGIPVHHYIQLDFAGFRQLVDAVGGVPLRFENPTRDVRTGLNIIEPGCVTLDSEEALAYARSRAYEELVDGEWERDPTADLGRIERQQVFIRATIGRALSQGALNPGVLNQMLDAALASVTVDGVLTTGEIVDVARRFRSFDPEDLQTYRLPVTPGTVGGAQIVRLVDDEAEPILALFRGTANDPGPLDDDAEDDAETVEGPLEDALGGLGQADDPASAPSPEIIEVRVLNGSGEAGQAGEAASALAQAGFAVVGQGNASEFGLAQTAQTQVRYPTASRPAAAVVERWLTAGARLVSTTAEQGTDEVVVVTGTDWQGVRTSPRAAGEGPSTGPGDPGGTPTTTTTITTTTTTRPPTTTTTTPTSVAQPC